jgi:hypothetical protein
LHQAYHRNICVYLRSEAVKNKMTYTTIEYLPKPFPDHTQLPESDGTFAENFYKHPQTIILTDSIWPILQQWHPDGLYAIGWAKLWIQKKSAGDRCG